MDIDMIVGMIFTLVLIAMVAGFILLFPIARQLGKYLDRRLGPAAPGSAVEASLREELRRVHTKLEAIEGEVERLAERQAFTDSLLGEREKQAIGS